MTGCVVSGVGPGADRGDGAESAGLVHQPAAVVGRADPGVRVQRATAMLLTGASVRHVRDLFRREGADAWFRRPVEELLPPGAKCPDCGGSDFRKENDILDVWFESGSSHRAVLAEASMGWGYPAYLYLEGSDQHRGWFQSSILTSVGSTGRCPFETVLTHGFVVDDKGEKMSKSVGNVIHAVKATEQYGADVLRLVCGEHGLRGRRADVGAGDQGGFGGVSQDSQHVPVLAGQSGGLPRV